MRLFKLLPIFILAALMVARAQEPPALPPTQEAPNLPELSPPVPRIAPPRPTADWCSTVVDHCPHGSHLDCGPQAMACVPDCPKGYHATASSRDVCITAKRPCVTISPLWPLVSQRHDWGWQASLCDPSSVVVSKVDLIYPERAIQEKRQGTVEIWGNGDEDGKVETTFVVGSYGDFQQAATTALKQWRWKPFLLNGKPIKFRMRIRYAFELTATGPQVRLLPDRLENPKTH